MAYYDTQVLEALQKIAEELKRIRELTEKADGEDGTVVPAVDPTIAPECNPPLTLDELREMDGEPVWVVGPEPGWALVNVQEEALYDSNTDFIPFNYYEIVWLAYRHKPEEVRHG